MHEDDIQAAERRLTATMTLWRAGWTPLGNWLFRSPSGTVHDMSAADLSQLELIERERMFVV